MNYTLIKLITNHFVTTQMELDGIMLSEINQIEEKIYAMISYIEQEYREHINKYREQINSC